MKSTIISCQLLPVDVALTISSEPTKEMESSLTHQESLMYHPEYTGEGGPLLSEQKQPAQPSELEMPTQPSEHALVHSQLHPPASYNVTAKPPELINEVETSIQQGFEPSKHLGREELLFCFCECVYT